MQRDTRCVSIETLIADQLNLPCVANRDGGVGKASVYRTFKVPFEVDWHSCPDRLCTSCKNLPPLCLAAPMLPNNEAILNQHWT